MQVKLLHRTAPSTLFTSRRVTAYRHITQEARSQIQSAIDSHPVVVFMKGTPAVPQCGFSRAVIQVLGIHGVPSGKMGAVDVLADDELRSAIKEFSLVSRHFNPCDINNDNTEPRLLTVTGLQFLKYTSMENLLVDAILFWEVSSYAL